MQSGFYGEVDLAALDRAKDACDKEIHQELYHSEDLYETIEYDGKNYFQIELEDCDSYPYGRIGLILIPSEN